MTSPAAAGTAGTTFNAQVQMFLDALGQGTDGPKTDKAGAGAKANKTQDVGIGSSAPTEGTADITQPNAMPTRGVVLAAALASLITMMPPQKSDDDTEVKLASIESKMKQTSDKVGEQEIDMDEARKRNAITAKRSAIENANTQMEKAHTAQKHMSTWDKVKLAFSYVGAILSIAAGVLALLTAPFDGGLGALAGGMLIAAGVMMLMMAIDQTMSSVPGKDGQPGKGFIAMTAESITKDMYPNDPDKQASEAAKWTMGLNCALMGASLICGIVGAVVNPAGAAEEVVEMADFAMDAEQTGTDAAEVGTTAEEVTTSAEDAGTAAEDTGEAADDAGSASSDAGKSSGETRYISPKTAQYIGRDGATTAKNVIRGGETANGILNSGTDAAPQAYGYIASQDTANAMTSNASAKQFAAIDKALDGALDALMTRIKADGERFSDALGSLMDAVNDHSQSMSHVKFRA